MIDKNWIEQRTDELCDKIDAARVRVEEIVAQNKQLIAALEALTNVLGRHELTPPAVCGCDFCQAYDQACVVLAKAKGK